MLDILKKDYDLIHESYRIKKKKKHLSAQIKYEFHISNLQYHLINLKNLKKLFQQSQWQDW